jgi:hypothetical protein
MPEIYKMGTMIKSISDFVVRNNISKKQGLESKSSN